VLAQYRRGVDGSELAQLERVGTQQAAQMAGADPGPNSTTTQRSSPSPRSAAANSPHRSPVYAAVITNLIGPAADPAGNGVVCRTVAVRPEGATPSIGHVDGVSSASLNAGRCRSNHEMHIGAKPEPVQ
jgi:hypothetical protein